MVKQDAASVCAGTGLLVSSDLVAPPLRMDRARIGLVGRRHRSPAKGVYWATATAVIFMVVPPDPPGHANAFWYVRQNA
jgi:hypothetical protein